jgi:hypothetical protein
VSGRLQPAEDLCFTRPYDQERVEKLATLIARQTQGTGRYLVGDLAKAGRLAEPEELRLYQSLRSPAPGVPAGLARCAACGEWRGECLDPNPRLQVVLVRVSCRCENVNRCARCGHLLAERRLYANYFDPADGHIWHVPGFCGLSHRCPSRF